jgi:hypothetical protein
MCYATSLIALNLTSLQILSVTLTTPRWLTHRGRTISVLLIIALTWHSLSCSGHDPALSVSLPDLFMRVVVISLFLSVTSNGLGLLM